MTEEFYVGIDAGMRGYHGLTLAIDPSRTTFTGWQDMGLREAFDLCRRATFAIIEVPDPAGGMRAASSKHVMPTAYTAGRLTGALWAAHCVNFAIVSASYLRRNMALLKRQKDISSDYQVFDWLRDTGLPGLDLTPEQVIALLGKETPDATSTKKGAPLGSVDRRDACMCCLGARRCALEPDFRACLDSDGNSINSSKPPQRTKPRRKSTGTELAVPPQSRILLSPGRPEEE